MTYPGSATAASNGQPLSGPGVPGAPAWPPPGQIGQQAGPFVAPPENYLAFAILVTLLCFLPTGVVAIVYSSKVNTAFYMGDHASAAHYSAEARKYCKLSVIIAAICVVGMVVWQLSWVLLMFLPLLFV